jgi:hypothetical protein
MAEVHQLIIEQGIESARRQAVSKHERVVIEAAYQVLSDDAEKIGFTYSGFALTSLPHKPTEDLLWKREGHNLTMLVESGRDRTGQHIGLPYGSFARFILLFLQSEAIKNQTREVELAAACGCGLDPWDYRSAAPPISGLTSRHAGFPAAASPSSRIALALRSRAVEGSSRPR